MDGRRQRKVILYSTVEIIVDAGHILPIEQPPETADVIGRWMAQQQIPVRNG